MPRPISPEIREFILRNVDSHNADIGSLTAAAFDVSRTTVSNYLQRLVSEGMLRGEGKTKARKYYLKPLLSISDYVPITQDLEDDFIWRKKLVPIMKGIPDNVIDVCHYGFTEIFNNVIDHSESDRCYYWYQRDYVNIRIGIHDFGIGIFEKIMKDFGLTDRRQALLELSKGKLTSDASRHSGEGIFFTSRMFDRFLIDSLDLSYVKTRTDSDGWLIEVNDTEHTEGTHVIMTIAINSIRTSKDVFLKYMDDEQRFARTSVPLTLAKYGNEQLVSRSQARRLMARVDKFSEVLLDFSGIETIGQAFADEIFRVYQREHPNVHVHAANTSENVDRMIKHALINASELASPASSEKPS
jgi:anti-sigma regulatory factor (Ser/Thr protein kinase)